VSQKTGPDGVFPHGPSAPFAPEPPPGAARAAGKATPAVAKNGFLPYDVA